MSFFRQQQALAQRRTGRAKPACQVNSTGEPEKQRALSRYHIDRAWLEGCQCSWGARRPHFPTRLGSVRGFGHPEFLVIAQRCTGHTGSRAQKASKRTNASVIPTGYRCHMLPLNPPAYNDQPGLASSTTGGRVLASSVPWKGPNTSTHRAGSWVPTPFRQSLVQSG